MTETQHLSEADAFDMHDVMLKGRSLPFGERVAAGARRAAEIVDPDQPLLLRETVSADGREVEMLDRETGEARRYLMFGSNNYLGLATHPEVVARAREALDLYGVGTPGPPLLNGHTSLHRELEQRLAALKGAEDALLFPSGYSANVGVISALMSDRDAVLLDQLAHASLWDGLKLAGVRTPRRFRHNDVDDLDALLTEQDDARDRFVVVDGVYSMDGDAAPLDRIVETCRRWDAVLVVDDAHATGVLGAHGRGAAEEFGVEGEVPITIGTLGKSFGVQGAFVAGSSDLVSTLRFFARSYVFSTALPPVVVAAALAGLDLLEREPERREHLRALVRRVADGLRPLGLVCEPAAAIVAVRAPEGMNVKRAVSGFERAGIFLNYVMHPAVPLHQQRFRISVGAGHTFEDVDQLVATAHEVWAAACPDAA